MDCNLYTLSKFSHPKGDYVISQVHTALEVVLYKNGCGNTTIDGIIYEYEHNSVAIILPNTYHDEWAEEETEVFFCIFEMQDAADTFENIVLADRGELTEELNKTLTTMEAELKGKAAFFNDRINLLLEELIIILKRMMHKVDVKYDIVEYVKRIFKQNISRGMNFHAIAESVGYSYDRFRHIFKEKTGISPAQYYINIRIAKAKSLLENSDLSVAKISDICGFRDVSNFITTFKAKVGVTPLKYRQAVNKATEKVLNFNELP